MFLQPSSHFRTCALDVVRKFFSRRTSPTRSQSRKSRRSIRRASAAGGRKEGRKDRAYVIHLSPHCLPKVSLCPLSYTYFTRPLSTHPMALSNNQYFKYSVLERTSLAYCSLDSHQVVFETLRRKIPVFFHRVNSGFGWSVARGRGSYIFQWSELYFLRSLPWRQV